MQDITHIIADLTAIDGQPMTTSRKVAARFKKQHKDVLRSIRLLAEEEEGVRDFAPTTYADSQGKIQPEYLISKDGFCLLAMGFTGADALSWKRHYIKAFNAMAEQIAEAARVPAVPGTVYAQALSAEKAEALSFRAASDAAKIMRARKEVKPILVQQLEMMREAVQLCLMLGLTKLPDVD